MIKVLDNKNNLVEINYCLIETYCKKECLNFIKDSDQNKETYLTYAKRYTYFKPYFDFVFSELKYTLNNPLLFNNAKLTNKDLKYYINEPNSFNTYDNYDFSLSNDFCIGLTNKLFSIESGFFILDDGTLLENNYVERHLKNAKTILNQYIIQSIRIYNLYLNYIEKNPQSYKYNIIDFMIEKIGVIHGRKNNKTIELIINSRLLTDKQYETIKKLKFYFEVTITDCNDYNKKIYVKK